MNNRWKKQGECKEQDVIEIIKNDCFDYFVAYQTNKFLSGRFDSDKINHIETDKLLEIRAFSDNQELLARRSMIGINHLFQWRIATEENIEDDEYIVRLQTLDIDQTKTKEGKEGNLLLMTTGGGSYELPVDKNHDSIKVISYISYDECGMAYIYDDRLAGFVTQGGRD